MQNANGKSAGKRWVIRIAVALGVFVIGIVALWLWRDYRIVSLLADIQAAGEPISADELNALYAAPPAERDATPLWLEAAALLKTAPQEPGYKTLPCVGADGPTVLPEIGKPWPDLHLAEKHLTQRSKTLELLHQASAVGGQARYPVDFRDGFSTLLTHAQDARELGRLLQLEALVRAHRGDAAGAAQSILGIFALARSLENEPCIISQLVSAAIEAVGIGELMSVVGRLPFSESTLTRFQKELRVRSYERSCYRGLLGERVMGIMALEDPSTVGLPPADAMMLRVMGRVDCEWYLQTMQRMIRASQLPLHEALAEFESMTAQLPTTGEKFAGGRFRLRMAPFARQFLPSLEWTGHSFGRAAARNFVADAALAVEHFRQRHNRLPENLSRLVPDLLPFVPIDPFDGRPIRYRIEPDGFVVYSVGKDGLDNGGMEDDQKTSSQPDVVFRVRIRPDP
jgi:hypothetical protein